MKLAKLFSIAVLSMPLMAQADLTVRERNLALGGVVIGAIAGSMMSNPSMPSMPIMNQYYVPTPQYIPPCRVRQYRTGIVEECGPYGSQRIYPQVQYYPVYPSYTPNVQIVYPRY